MSKTQTDCLACSGSGRRKVEHRGQVLDTYQCRSCGGTGRVKDAGLRPATLVWCTGGSSYGLEAAIEKLQQELPGWWWSVGNCHVSADATIGPDRNGPDRHLLKLAEFDNGIDGSLLHPATVAEAMLHAIELAKVAKAKAAA